MSSLLIKFPLDNYVPGMGCRPETSLLCLNGKLTTGDRRLGHNRGFPTAGYLHPATFELCEPDGILGYVGTVRAHREGEGKLASPG